MATSKIPLNIPQRPPYLPTSLSYVNNHTVTTYPGFISGGTKDVAITINTPWNVGSLWDAAHATVSVLYGSLRSINGYLRNDLANTNLLDIADLTWEVLDISAYAFVIKGTFTNAVSGATNNTPVMFTGKITIKSTV